jgi:Uncharacterised protein domain (DUF2415)
MTVSNRDLYESSTDNLARHHRYYPTKIAVRHHQLRHLVSVSEGDRVYYVNSHDVYVLDLKTNQSTLLATILFEARCLAARHGWVCVGGEHDGTCALIRLEPELGVPKCFGHSLSVDVLGGEIVNSMNIHLMKDEPDSEPEPIVLISNNDKTIKIFSLAQREVLTTLEHDTPMNYATLSPDSTILAAVGDSDKVYFYKRRKLEPSESKWQTAGKYPEYDWRPMAVPVIPTGDEVYDDYGFAVTFSPSGHLCAASSQGGAISVFNMSSLQESKGEPEEAILCTFRSSRPTLWGCVRAMAFSPPPWDLLAWAEDHGRIGVADVRQMFVRRQSLALDKTKAEMIHVEDMTPEEYRDLELEEKLKQQDLARPQTRRGPISDRERTGSLLQDAQINAAQRRQRRQDIFSRAQGAELDARERSVLEALETTMDDVERYNQPYSVNYTSSPRLRSSSINDAARDYEVQLLNPDRRGGPRVHQPRRRTSVVLSESTGQSHLVPSDSPRPRISASPGRMTDDEDFPTMSTNDLTPTRGGSSAQPLPYNIPTSDPWHVIQSALETARQSESRTSTTSDSPASLAQIEAALEAERRLGSQLERQLADERQLSTLLRHQLETQERLLQSQQQQLQAEREAGARLEPSLERLLHRELESEQQFGEQRSQELETEIRLGTNRARRLEAERSRLLGSGYQSTQETVPSAEGSRFGSSLPMSSSALSTTLPTTNTSLANRLPTPVASFLTSPSTESLSLTLQRHEAFRRQREAHIENLERQVRRAESRVASASSDIQALESAMQRGLISDRLARQSEARARAAANSSASSGAVAASTASELTRERERDRHRERIRAAIAGEFDPPSTITVPERRQTGTQQQPVRAITELSNRVRESEMRVARMMFLGRANLDGNGNWVAGAGLQRVMAQAAANSGEAGAREGGNSGTPLDRASVADVVREMGVGTAGISWSTDGSRL